VLVSIVIIIFISLHFAKKRKRTLEAQTSSQNRLSDAQLEEILTLGTSPSENGIRKSPSFILQRGPIGVPISQSSMERPRTTNLSQSSLERPRTTTLVNSEASGSLSRGLGVARNGSTSMSSEEVLPLPEKLPSLEEEISEEKIKDGGIRLKEDDFSGIKEDEISAIKEPTSEINIVEEQSSSVNNK
jgi:hypothetical protein